MGIFTILQSDTEHTLFKDLLLPRIGDPNFFLFCLVSFLFSYSYLVRGAVFDTAPLTAPLNTFV